MLKAVGDKPAHRLTVVILQVALEISVELFQMGPRLNAPVLGIHNRDVVDVGTHGVKFIVNLPHDLLDHVFNRDQP